MINTVSFSILLFVFSLTLNSSTSSSPLLIEGVSVSQNQIAFSSAGKIWTVSRNGGEAKRLTTMTGEETLPEFSPDGSTIAFSQSTGNRQNVHTVPSTGGKPTQLTYINEDDEVVGWTPDGKSVLFRSHRDEEWIFRLYKISTQGGLPEPLPFPLAFTGSFSNDSARIAYSPRMPMVSEWRHYRGGMKGRIWLASPKTGVIEKLPEGDYNDLYPMWIGTRIYFVSDRTGHMNLFSYDIGTKKTVQRTKFDNYGITFASAGKNAIVFVRSGHIYLYEIGKNTAKKINIIVEADKSELKAKQAGVARSIDWIVPSTSAEKIALNARGEILIFDPKTKAAQNITNTSGVAERYAEISPDNRRVAYFSDESGEYELHIQPLDGGETKKIPIEQKPTFYREIKWSSDSKKIAFTDKKLSLWIADVVSGKTQKIDSSSYSYQEEWGPNWSHDGRFLVYSKHLKNRIRTIFVRDVTNNRTHQITDGVTHTESPVFDKNGKYLYFLSSLEAGASEYGWGVPNGMRARPLVQRNAHLFILANNKPSPLLRNGRPNPRAKPSEVEKNVRIDFDGLRRRVINLPIRRRDFSRLSAGKPGNIFARVTQWDPSPGLLSRSTENLYQYGLSDPRNFKNILENIGDYAISHDGGHLLYTVGRNIYLVDASTEFKKGDGQLDLSKVRIEVDPKAEWKQMYRESWRIMRDWFYDPNHHGQDIAALEKHFAEYLPGISRRSDLNRLFNHMLGHVSVSHMGVRGGDMGRGPRRRSSIGMLGADYEIDGGLYRFKRIFRSSNFDDPAGTFAAPLDQPGLNVKEGDYLLAVNGKKIDVTKNIFAQFDGTIGRPTKITIASKRDGSNARTISVVPTGGENRLRRMNWAMRNRKIVEEKSGGKLGYIYIGNYGPGISNFIRGLAGYSSRKGIIIDQRFNGGGITSDYLIEWLKRNPIYYYNFREGDDIATPVNPGPLIKVLITNEQNFSAAETFAFMFKLGKVGPIVGEQTYGGGIGGYVFSPTLLDGARITIPNRAAFNPDGSSWGIENVGVEPDHRVGITPKDCSNGHDPQLEKAVSIALSEIKKGRKRKKQKPRYPVHPK